MKIVYVADDGTQFDEEYDCINYEWSQNHKDLQSIIFVDKNRDFITDDIFSDSFYSKVWIVIVTTQSGVDVLQEFAEYTGFCNFHDIVFPGVWVRTGNFKGDFKCKTKI